MRRLGRRKWRDWASLSFPPASGVSQGTLTPVASLTVKQRLTYYYLTFSIYGTYLPGDSRGSTNRYDGRLPPLQALQYHAACLMPEIPFRLENVEDRRLVLNAIMEGCRYRGWRLIALHIREAHLHGVVQVEAATPGRVMGDWKSYGSRSLKVRWPERKQFWARGGDCRSVDGDGLNQVLRYVLEEQGEPMEICDAG